MEQGDIRLDCNCMQRRIDHLLLAVVAMLAACSRGRAPESRRAAPPIAIHAVPRSAPDSAARVAALPAQSGLPSMLRR